jgi:hypothetical protein
MIYGLGDNEKEGIDTLEYRLPSPVDKQLEGTDLNNDDDGFEMGYA